MPMLGAGGGKSTVEIIIAAKDLTAKAFAVTQARMGKLKGIATKLTNTLKTVAKAGVLVGAALAAATVGAAIKSYTDFEDAMASVRKTTGMTKEEIAHLSSAISDMANRMPIAHTELADIAAIAGQLGIQGKENIMSFTETVAMMATAFDMPAEAAATAMAKLGKIYDIPIEQTSNLASAINVLGNTTAAKEADILNFSMALGPTARQLGFAATEALAMGASMISIGMDASDAGTRLSRAFSMIGRNIDEVAGFVGMAEDEFRQLFEERPMDAFMMVIDKLSQVEGKLEANTIASELFNEVGAKAIKGLAGDVEGLETNLKNAETGFKENISLTEEYAAKTDTLKASIQTLKNNVTTMLIDIGAALAPVLNTLIDGFRDALPKIKEVFFEIGTGVREFGESISRQIKPALGPLVEAAKEAGEKMSAGLKFSQLADDIGVLIGAGLRPLVEAFGWVVDKLGPLWEIIGTITDGIHTLAGALKTEEGKLDDVRDATNELNNAKQKLIGANETLAGKTTSLADALQKANGWTKELTTLEATAKIKTDALAQARADAAQVIGKYEKDSDEVKAAIDRVKQAEEEATTATGNYRTVLGEVAGVLVDTGVASDDVTTKFGDFETATEGLIKAEEDVVTKTEDLKDEVKGFGADLGDAFEGLVKMAAAIPVLIAKNFGVDLPKVMSDTAGKIKATIAKIPPYIAEQFAKIPDIVGAIFTKVGKKIAEFGESLPDFIGDGVIAIGKSFEDIGEAFDKFAVVPITASAKEIEEKLSKDIPKASKEMQEAMDDATTTMDTDLEGTQTELDKTKDKTEDVTTAVKEFGDESQDAGEKSEKAFSEVAIQVGDTEVTFKGLASKVMENVDSFEDLQKVAETLINMDWQVFRDLEAVLPDIGAGIGDMESAFAGLEIVLVDNLTKLESVKESIESIGDMIAPYIEEGFLNGIQAIGDFAGALSDAGNAINTFGSLTEANVEGCIRFSTNIHGMVSALKILDSQMADLMPSFGDMKSLIGSIAYSFVWSGDKSSDAIEGIQKKIGKANVTLKGYGITQEYLNNILEEGGDKAFDLRREFSALIDGVKNEITPCGMAAYHALHDVVFALKETTGHAISFDKAMKYLVADEKTQNEMLETWIHTSSATTFQFNKQTGALKGQTEQLNKITEALQPLLNFLDTLNKIAALSAISQDELNTAFQNILDTLTHLGIALNEIDFETPISNLVKDSEGFRTTMEKNAAPLDQLNFYVGLLTDTILGLVQAFEALGSIEESVLKDTDKLETIFVDITTITDNLTEALKDTAEGGKGFADQFATGFEDMLSAAAPLINYFRENQAVVIEFNSTLGLFMTTVSHVVDVMQKLKEISELTIPTQTELEIALKSLTDTVNVFSDALSEHLDISEEGIIQNTDNIITAMEGLTTTWGYYNDAMGDNLPTLQTAATSFSHLSSAINSLINAYKDIKDSVIPTAEDYVVFLEKSTYAINEFQKGLDIFLESPDNLSRVMESLTGTWAAYDEVMEDNLPTLRDAASSFSTLTTSINTLINAYKDIKDVVIPTSEDYVNFLEITTNAIGEFQKGLDIFLESPDSLSRVMESLTGTWEKYDKILEDNLPTLKKASDSFGTLTSSILSLISGFASLKDVTELTFDDFDDGMKKIARTIPHFTRALEINIDAIVEALKDLDVVWAKYADDMEDLVPTAGEATNAFTKLTSSVLSLGDAFTKLMKFGEMSEAAFDTGLQKLMRTFDNFAKSLDKNIEALMESLQGLVTEWLENEDQMVYLMRAFVTIAGNFITVIGYALRLADAFGALKDKTGIIKDGVDDLIGIINHLMKGLEGMYSADAAKNMDLFLIDVGNIITALNNLKTTLNVDVTTAFGNLSKIIEEASGKAITAIGAIGEAVNSLLSTIREAASSISGIFRNAIASIKGMMASAAASAYGWGSSLMSSFAGGLYSQMGAIVGAMAMAAGIVNSYLGVHSNTKLGALSHLEEFGPNLVRTFLEGIRGELPNLNKTLSSLSMGGISVQGEMAGAVGSGSSTNTTIYMTNNIQNRADADHVINEVTRLMRKPAIV